MLSEREAVMAELPEIFDAYVEQLGHAWPTMLGLALVTIVAGLAWNLLLRLTHPRETPWAFERWVRLALVLASIGYGLKLVIDRAACFDDAYISFRYAENLIAGEGLVYNPGERVEGYTNFLWTILIASLHAILPIETPLIAVILCVLAYVANLLVVWRIGLTIAPPWHERALGFPIAVVLLAVQNTFVDYGTSGLETGFASLLVNLGVLALGAEPRARNTFAAGLCWILATLARPDHAIFYAVGSAVVLGLWIVPSVRALRSERSLRAVWRAGLAPMLAYAAPFSLWLAHTAWKLHYYGELLPNTYYAKSAYLTYYEQGWVYAAEFHLGSHLWIVLVLIVPLLAIFRPAAGPGRRFLAFALPAILLYEWYVIRVGGDFMAGRFYVSLIPLMLLSAELLVREIQRRGSSRMLRPLTLLVAGLVMATAMGVRLIPARDARWYLSDESTYYPIASWSPITIAHSNYAIGVALGNMHEQGIEPVIASGAIGLIGYYSKLPLVDRLGLVDATVAHQEIRKRGRPGHEKWATTEYLESRGVHFVRGGPYPSWFKRFGTIRFGRTGGRAWWIYRYDREMMRAIAAAAPDARFHDFEAYLDRYIARMPQLDPDKVRREYEFFRRYYFDHNDDTHRELAFETYLAWVERGNQPIELVEQGRWDAWTPSSARTTPGRRVGRLDEEPDPSDR